VSDDRGPTHVTVTNPAQPPTDILLVGGERPGRSRRLTAVVVVLATLGALVVAVQHQRAQHARQAEVERRSSAVHLALSSGSLGSQSDGTPGREWYVEVEVRSTEGEDFTLLSAALDQGPWKHDLLTDDIVASAHTITFRLAAGCSTVGHLKAPTQLRVKVRRRGGNAVTQTVLLGDVHPLELPRQDCGFASVGASFRLDLLGGHRRGKTITLTLEVRNGSRERATLVGVAIEGAHVTSRTALPLALPPFSGDEAGRPVGLTLVVTYDRCPRVAPGQSISTNITFDLADSHGSPVTNLIADTGSLVEQLLAAACA
jgi:hypothetical protein